MNCKYHKVKMMYHKVKMMPNGTSARIQATSKGRILAVARRHIEALSLAYIRM